jgi:hypothetical protein
MSIYVSQKEYKTNISLIIIYLYLNLNIEILFI